MGKAEGQRLPGIPSFCAGKIRSLVWYKERGGGNLTWTGGAVAVPRWEESRAVEKHRSEEEKAGE